MTDFLGLLAAIVVLCVGILGYRFANKKKD